MNDVTYKKKPEPKSKGLKNLLFFANWLFVVFLSKRFFPSPAGGLDFVVKNLGSFLVASVITAIMLHFSSRKTIILLIPTMVILALAIVMT